ncbi:hypothetical protein Q765_13835 [Flavobacterium rivuli WB 3.3-2 = DSM 21788]|uniref:Peptidase S9 prolyl oligopeptidase catalytic domain-containing protein n=1 Tax=Flavobacterium rivuli WB 3.3-2 = DSM 21788 TaxID=1121895 RepID=A0A0A2LZU8_9FLAO|nr:prolyl oligopeptidase family serine peptidase [Flavobacterium rivuli]KGO85907.1 hypothetical protein Q765_13835 [Flavobacterium rivuli WB 3.3-2 = DSM 21788]
MEKYDKIVTIFFVVLTCSLYGQAQQKRELSQKDYGLWSTVEMQNASEKGEWISYNVLYKGLSDTLFVKNKAATRTYGYPKAYNGKFIHDRWFVCQLPEAVVLVLDLKNGASRLIDNVLQYAVSVNGEYIIYTTNNGITLSNADSTIKWKQPGVKSFSLSPAGTELVHSTPDHVFYTSLKDTAVLKPRRISGSSGCMVTGFAWQANGDSFAFVTKCGNATELSLYKVAQDSLINFNIAASEHPVGTQTDIIGDSSKFRISDDGTTVFFPIKSRENLPVSEDNVQIWNGGTALTYSEEVLYGRTEDIPKIMVWQPATGESMQLTNNEYPSMFLSGDQKCAISYYAWGKVPNFAYYPKTDYYITDLKSLQTKLLLQGQSADPFEITASPAGKYIAYLKDDSWWIYTIDSGRHVNISEIISASIKSRPVLSVGKFVVDLVGWSSGDQKLIINDGFDMWQVNLDNFLAERITKGRKNKRIFRFVNPSDKPEYTTNFDGMIFPQIDLKQEYILRSLDVETKKYGYYIWKGKPLPMVLKDKNLAQLIYSTKNAIRYFVEQDFDAPPTIVAAVPNGKEQVIYRSNRQHDKFHWGCSKVVSYVNSKNIHLQAGLYYPANFDPDKKYPLVVYIYEELSNGIHDYVNPTLQNYIGFNITNLTSRGYFVLCPDISYQLGDVGKSAADCIISATNSVMGIQGINPVKIALFGHSFGGYEAAFTATQTNIFTTIIAGAAITDMASAYLDISDNGAQPNIWRFETQQWRMGKSLYQDQQGYQRNSTIYQAEEINTPLLLFSGEKDGQVDVKQSIELYLALRRLAKPEIMLIYPDEGHVLMDRKNQEDFTIRLEQWLDYFLKNDPVPGWMKNQF